MTNGRTYIILSLCLSMVVGAVAGSANGGAIRLNDDGKLVVESLHIRHLHLHAEGSHHHVFDLGQPDGEHRDLHFQIASDEELSVRRIDRPIDQLKATQFISDLNFICGVHAAFWAETTLSNVMTNAASCRGSIAPRELANLRSIMLLV